jgi:hypothetical protein
VDFGNNWVWWSSIEKWINSKPNDEKKQALQSAFVDANNVLTQIKAAL